MASWCASRARAPRAERGAEGPWKRRRTWDFRLCWRPQDRAQVVPHGSRPQRTASPVRAECLGLLRDSLVGRVIVTDRALPAAFPVNFALLGEDVVFRTLAGSKLEAASARAVVAFEVDDLDAVRQTGWSVLIQGRAALIEDPVDLVRARALPLHPWAPGRRLEFVRIRSELVSGRRIPQPAPVFARA